MWRRTVARSKGFASRGVFRHQSNQTPRLSDRARALVNAFDARHPIENASTPPTAWYTDPEFLQAERNTVFRRHWIPVGHTAQLAQVGDYLTGTFANAPYVVVRNEEPHGCVAFSNVCRHHAALVASGDKGHVDRAFQCPYHGWSYDRRSGRLLKATRLQGIRDFRAAAVGLPSIPLLQQGALLLLHFAGNKQSSADTAYLDQLHKHIAHTEYERMQFIKRVVYTVDANWKVVLDNYLDGGYHVPFAHPHLHSQLDAVHYRSELFDGFSIQSAKIALGASARVKQGVDPLYIFLHPTTCLNFYGPWLDINHVLPVTHRRTRIVFDYFLHPSAGTNAAFIEDSLRESDRVQQEDKQLCESVQAGLESGAFDTGRYAPRVEHPMHHFHQLLSHDLSFGEVC